MATNELEPKLERMTPLKAEQILPHMMTAKNGKSMKVFFESPELLAYTMENLDSFQEGLDALAEEHPEAISVVTSEGVQVFKPEGEQEIREVIANIMFSASTHDLKHVYVRDMLLCQHCAKPYCNVRKTEYVGEMPDEVTEDMMSEALGSLLNQLKLGRA